MLHQISRNCFPLAAIGVVLNPFSLFAGDILCYCSCSTVISVYSFNHDLRGVVQESKSAATGVSSKPLFCTFPEQLQIVFCHWGEAESSERTASECVCVSTEGAIFSSRAQA